MWNALLSLFKKRPKVEVGYRYTLHPPGPITIKPRKIKVNWSSEITGEQTGSESLYLTKE